MSTSRGVATKDHSLSLECGTSLAELEYASELEQKQRRHEEDKQNGDSSTNTMVQATTPANSDSATFPLEEKIHAIQNYLSDDVVTTNNYVASSTSISMFTSPFETPQARQGSGQTEIPEAQRYASVPLIYCDQTASNRPLKSIENYIHQTCLPFYGNTHTNTSVTGSQSTAFVAEARQVVAEGVNAKITGKAASDVVLFA